MSLVTPQDPKEWAAKFMTPAQAQAALKRPLVFADSEQLQARALLEELERTTQAVLKCQHSYRRRNELCACLKGFRTQFLEYATGDDRMLLKERDFIGGLYRCLRKST